MTTRYTLGLFANMYPAFEGDYRGSFISQMVRDLEFRNITVKKAVKTSSSVTGYIPFFWDSLRLARDEELDLIQAEYIPHSSIIPAFTKRNDVPLVLKFHGDDARIFPFRNRINMMLTRSMISRASHIITASEEMRQIIIGLGSSSSQVTAIHTGVDTDFFVPRARENSREELQIKSDELIFLFAGRLHPSKGIGEIIEVALLCPQATFVFLGPGKIPVHPKNCSFMGIKNHEDVRTWLNASDCLILPTHTEAIPTSVMEAFSCGIPAITSNIGGCPEIVDDMETGLLVPPRDVPALRDAVLWMAENPGKRRAMGERARKEVLRRFDHNTLTDKLVRVHRMLIDRK